MKIYLPPLIKRREDIPLLVNYFIERFNKRMGKTIESVSPEVLELLLQYDYQGNVRELENIIEHSCVMCQEIEIELKHLPPEMNVQKKEDIKIKPVELLSPFQNVECKLILDTLEKNNGSKTKTAKELKLHRATLYRKMKKYNLL